jgi:cell wall-associated NlpC family hydrolase
VSHPARIRSLALAAAILAGLPAGALAATGGAAAPAADGGSAGGAGVGLVAPAHRTSARRRAGDIGGASAHRRARRHRRRPARPATPTAASAPPTVPATLLADGTASPPAGAPAEVAAVIAAGNRIASLPYRWGGGHASWDDGGYDCSGSVGYALHGGGLLDATSDSSGLMSYGERGSGAWITIYANPDHVYMVVAGLRFDTSGAHPSRWQTASRSHAGFAVRHPVGF